MPDTRIAELRNAKGWTQADLAAAVQPQTTKVEISRFETGARPGLTLGWLRRIAKALGCRVSDLLIDEDVSVRLAPSELAIIARLRTEPDYNPDEVLALLIGLKRLAAHMVARQGAKKLPGAPLLVEQLADIWSDLDEHQRMNAVEMMRAAANIASSRPPVVPAIAAE